MFKKVRIIIFILLILIINSSLLYAKCSENQIDINSASISELDKIYGIGKSKAQAIIDARPYKILDDLINAYGIGEKTLENIKNQGLACVKQDNLDKSENKTNSENENKEIIKFEKIDYKKNISEKKEIPKNFTFKTIKLNPKTIKTDFNSENSDKVNYSLYGFFAFSIIIIVLFAIRFKKINSNEFK